MIRPAESSDLKRVAEDDGSSGPKKKRKSVSFKPEKELVEVRYFESGEDEVCFFAQFHADYANQI